MNKAPFPIRLLATLVISLTVVSNAYARNIGDPQKNGCNRDGKTLASQSVRISEYTLKVEMRWSQKCKAKWVKAYIPKGTRLYLKDKSGKRYVEYTAQVNGWNYSDMDNDKKPFQACVQHPSRREELCTASQ
ncbi:YjfA family protein [Microcoleus sp. ZQ-A2]|nr:DUF2690 domain-containing protein [Microcoleus sp. FACHB-1]